jgi:ABC-type lipoprotein release transport system permease subunit
MALGATPGRVQMGVLSTTLRMAVVGVAVGTVASLGASRLIASLLFGTEATDPALSGHDLFTGDGGTASRVPARRASRIDPMVALRNN